LIERSDIRGSLQLRIRDSWIKRRSIRDFCRWFQESAFPRMRRTYLPAAIGVLLACAAGAAAIAPESKGKARRWPRRHVGGWPTAPRLAVP